MSLFQLRKTDGIRCVLDGTLCRVMASYHRSTTLSKQYYQLQTYLLIYCTVAVLGCRKIGSCNIISMKIKLPMHLIWVFTYYLFSPCLINEYEYFIVFTLDLYIWLVLVNRYYIMFLLAMLCLYLKVVALVLPSKIIVLFLKLCIHMSVFD